MIKPMAAVRNDGPMPNRSNRSGGAGFSMAHGPTCSTPTGRGAERFRGVDVDMPEIGAPARRRGSGADAFPGERRGGDAPGVRLWRRGTSGDRGIRPARNSSMRRQSIGHWLCTTSKCHPKSGRDALPHLVTDAFRAHEAEGEVLAVGEGASASDEHGRTVAGCAARRKDKIYFMALHLFPRPRIKRSHAKIREIGMNPPPIPAPGGKDGPMS